MSDKKTIVIKYGGNAMVNEQIRNQILKDIAQIHQSGHKVVLVHGGGPFINKLLDELKLESEFVDGHRRTTDATIGYIEMALTGEVNPSLVRTLNAMDVSAVGLSGKDASLVVAEKKFHKKGEIKTDIGWVGRVEEVNTKVLDLLLGNEILPVITCMAADRNGQAYNINGDMVAGHIAGALKADHYVVLTDVDGLFEDIHRPDSLISHLTVAETKKLMGSVISGGMIPKIESCLVALEKGAKSVDIINGTMPGIVTGLIKNKLKTGTKITK